MERPFVERAELMDFRLAKTEGELLRLNPCRPLTLVCDKIEVTYWFGEKLLVFKVSYAQRATDSRGGDVWRLSTDYGILFMFEGAPPTQQDAELMSQVALRLAHDYFREWAHYITRHCGLPPLVIDLAKFPQTA